MAYVSWIDPGPAHYQFQISTYRCFTNYLLPMESIQLWPPHSRQDSLLINWLQSFIWLEIHYPLNNMLL